MSKRSLGLLLLAATWVGGSGVAHATVTIDEDPIAIGTVTVGVQATRSSTLRANPDETVKIVLATGCGEFSLLSGSPVTVGNGGAGADPATVTFRVLATTAGAKDCTVEVRNNGNDQLRITFHITATAVASPVITINPAPTFTDTEVGATGSGQLLRAKNTGTGPLTITGAALQSGAGDYQVISGPTSITLQPNDEADWSIACKPSTFGTRTGSFRIASNAANAVAGNTDVALTCVGRQGVAASATSTLPFGQVIQGVTKPLTLTLRNDGNSTISNITATLSDPNKGYAVAALTQTSLNGGATMVVTVNFAPQSGTDGGPVTLTLAGVWGANNTPTSIQVGLDGDGLGVSFSAAQTVDFGSFRFDARPTRTYTIRNTGEIALSINTSTFTPDSATSNGELAFVIRRNGATVSLPQTLGLSGGAADQLEVTVTAQPNARIGSIGGNVLLTSTTAPGVAQTVTITGTVTAAAISATIVVDFGAVDIDGDPATDMVTITNTGSAILDIPSFAKPNLNNAFRIDNPTMATVAVGASLTIPVTYTPSVERAAPNIDDGVLIANLAGVIGPTMAMIRVQGRGIDRHINVMPVTDEPLAFPNQTNTTPITATVRNSGEAMLHITSAKVEPASEWKIVEGGVPSAGEILVNGGTEHAFKIEFTPTSQGEEITGELILETDDNGVSNGTGVVRIPLKGVSLFVEARGGGGCSTGSPGAGAGLIVGFAALLLCRRRARRTHPAATSGPRTHRSAASAPRTSRSTTSGSRTIAALLFLAAVLAFAPIARGDGVELTVFEPTPATMGTGFQVQSPDVGANGNWVATSTLSYASDPLLLDTKDPRDQSVASQQSIQTSALLQLGVAYAFLDRFEVGAHLPLYMQTGKASGSDKPPADGNALGNLSLHAKLRLWRGGGLGLGASAAVGIPTATKDQLTGSDQVEGRVQLLGSFTPAAMRRFAITANAGPVLRPESSYVNFKQQSGVAWGVGGSFRLLESLWATAEMFGVSTPSGKLPRNSKGEMEATMLSQVEWLAGVNFKADRRFTIGVAAGRGVTEAIGSPALRGVLSLSYVPGAPAISPIHPPEPPKPQIDSDGDGLLDSVDRCPSEAEDKDLFDDDDGCPDADNDKDGVADAKDKCPLDAEDKDGFQDDDGCPEADNDSDGVADAKDKCANEAEDKDGFEDLDGCPEADNDRDGIADAQDKCPNEPETINAVKDDDGCPDKGDSTIAISPDRIETLDPIVFTGVKIARPSFNVLSQVGATLRARTEIVRVRITVHVQPSKDPDGDQTKSDKRAQAIREWLIQQFAIAPTRLEVRGFGGTKPLVPADSRGAAKINDRVELIILERK